MNRRDFLLTLAASACLPGCAGDAPPRLPPGAILGPADGRAHRLRGRDFPPPAETRRIGVAIVGGGVAGLSAAWKLARAGFHDFRLFELEDEVGGNARYGRNAVSAYPWGAHYLPLPGREARVVRELLADLGVLLGDPYAATPRYDERHLCFAPQERLYRNGAWQEGLLPQVGVTKRDREQYRQFFQMMADFRRRRGRDGRRAFAIPMALSSGDADLLALDRFPMRDYLLRNGLDSEPLHWYVNYTCRDDYGTDYREVSAWAGVHYFASRDGRAEEAESDQVLTWPEGNGWLVQRMRERLQGNIETGALVHRIEETPRQAEVDVFSARENRSVRWQAEQVVFAAPAFVLPHVLANPEAELAGAARAVQYAPWLVANLTLREPPITHTGVPLAWDNVLHDSPALGYVVATHQSLRSRPGPTVLTYYRAMAAEPPQVARKRLLETPWGIWAEEVLRDLSRPHPELREQVERLDIFRWGHAMARPAAGFITGEARRRLNLQSGRLHLAHADLSGFSLFEEANYRGVAAAEKVLAKMGKAGD